MPTAAPATATPTATTVQAVALEAPAPAPDPPDGGFRGILACIPGGRTVVFAAPPRTSEPSPLVTTILLSSFATANFAALPFGVTLNLSTYTANPWSVLTRALPLCRSIEF